MLYCVPLTANWTQGASPFSALINKGDWLRTLMSLLDPGVPKNACQIWRSYDATALRIMVGYFWSPRVYCPFHACGQSIASAYSQCFLTSQGIHETLQLGANARNLQLWGGTGTYYRILLSHLTQSFLSILVQCSRQPSSIHQECQQQYHMQAYRLLLCTSAMVRAQGVQYNLLFE